MSGVIPDPYARLRATTPARIGLGRVGDGLPTRAVLEFQAAHSRARDAVHGRADFDAVANALAPLESLRVRSRVEDRAQYLRRPDLGRRLRESDLSLLPRGDWDLAFVIADGLSAEAVNRHAAPLVHETLHRLPGWRAGPVVLAEQARVALGDEVGEVLGAKLVAVLVGERPGLSVADSLGVYLTWEPRVGRADSERNCISNIHGNGLSVQRAADTLAWLLDEARSRRVTGVGLKLEALDNGVSSPAIPA
ncbi:ethanolamine ammonia-lyase subunit EutC [Solimonas sp. SE-A11]|uniref:ethanolamine ammonia-lyase subunit EutC n=1 Tax=Solimonas sp. SE-A11 TaxID=3054954 RepID=UPI00259CDD07|nr:ethanolamine ammonia-lyase subunit EutC [Solimonas sp. SE-A11]MDM4770611.1 ethanolamine ammonia-lyase subunit EutC [Solimonas sp. SE-A11]